jgi:type IV secretory pathway VirB10-like protein
MDILLYLLIAAFIGYVAYALGSLIFIDESKSQSRAPAASSNDTVAKQQTKPKSAAAKPKPSPTAKAKPAAAKKAAPAKPKPAAKPKAAPAKSTTAKATDNVIAFRNPDTGEEAKIPPSYPFSKRWIKDALITEGLLDRIYKNNELDDANTKKVTEALEKLKTIEKYVVTE